MSVPDYEPSGADRFKNADGTPNHDAIRRAERFAFTWWGGTTRHDDEDGAA